MGQLTVPKIHIDGRAIGDGEPPYIIAELSGNHNGDIECAFTLIKMAKLAGANAVKIQTYTADTLTIDFDGPGFVISGGPWDGRTLYDLYREAHTPWDWHEALFARGKELGITVFSSPFDATAVDFLEELNVPAYKIASFEIVDLALIERVAATGKPLIMSTGLANQCEITEAVDTAHAAGANEIALLHCVSSYPTPVCDSNLRTISDMRERFNVVIGLSDHTLDTAVPLAAISLGASIIEKHLTLRRANGGTDAAFSLEPDEMSKLCTDCQTIFDALGQVFYERTESEKESAAFRRSLYIVEDVDAGQVLTQRHVRSIRPGYGLPPKYLNDVVGRITARNIKRGTPMAWDFLKGGAP